MGEIAQHVLVLAIALVCATVIIVRRVRAFRGNGALCDGCAHQRECEPKHATPIPPSALVRKHRLSVVTSRDAA